MGLREAAGEQAHVLLVAGAQSLTGGREEREVHLDRTELDRAIAAVERKHDLAEIEITALLAATPTSWRVSTFNPFFL